MTVSPPPVGGKYSIYQPISSTKTAPKENWWRGLVTVSPPPVGGKDDHYKGAHRGCHLKKGGNFISLTTLLSMNGGDIYEPAHREAVV